ncbi:hypothetical protein WKI68_12285 [Streptomyces sp. MS1.HAVA.3]|uniref:Uncharacterized protein n=1 Tax=Streptomyces caledonius TaxID=3134107 RepID=A0ABU8U3W5_9ACTN
MDRARSTGTGTTSAAARQAVIAAAEKTMDRLVECSAVDSACCALSPPARCSRTRARRNRL